MNTKALYSTFLIKSVAAAADWRTLWITAYLGYLVS